MSDSFNSGRPRVLIVDDEQTVCCLLHDELENRGYSCTVVMNGNDAFARLQGDYFDVVLLDLRLPGISGMQILHDIQLRHFGMAVIVISGVSDTYSAVEAMKLGASDYIIKPFEIQRVENGIRKALESNEVARNRNNMDVIVASVEADLDPFDSYTRMVVERTVEVSRQLEIPEKEIQKWAGSRLRREKEKRQKVELALDKLKHSAMGQFMLGLTVQHISIEESDEHRN